MAIELRKCSKLSWAWCDGDCEKCRTFATTETVYNRYMDTAGNYHWTGTYSGEHIVRMGEAEMYKSPIEVKLDDIISNVVERTDEYMVRCVQQVGVDVDKDQLFKALEYDRRQYEKGYEDGWADAKKHGHWKVSLTGWVYCSVCNEEPPDETNIRSKYCPNCGAKMDEVEERLTMPKADGSTIPKDYMMR